MFLIKEYHITSTFVLPAVGLVLRKINRLPTGNDPEIMVKNLLLVFSISQEESFLVMLSHVTDTWADAVFLYLLGLK